MNLIPRNVPQRLVLDSQEDQEDPQDLFLMLCLDPRPPFKSGTLRR